jgi:hypothetical protein
MSESSIRTAQAEEQAQELDQLAEMERIMLADNGGMAGFDFAGATRIIDACKAGASALRARTDAWQPVDEHTPTDCRLIACSEVGVVGEADITDDGTWFWADDVDGQAPFKAKWYQPMPSPPSPDQTEKGSGS